MNNLQTLFKKPLIIIILLLILIAVILLIIRSFIPGAPSLLPDSEKPSLVFEQKDVILSFDPNTLTASSGGKIAADIVIDAGDAPISSIKLDVSYDTNALSNVTITPYKDPNSALSYSFIASQDASKAGSGTIITTYTLINGAQEQKGTAILAKFSATYSGTTPTTVNIFSDSKVSTKGNYILNLGRVSLDIFPR